MTPNKFEKPLIIAGLTGVFIFIAGEMYAAPTPKAPVIDITSGGARVRGGPTIDERITKLESVLENRTLEEFSARLDAMQQELQRLQGDAESANHNLEEIKRKQRDLYLDLDRRMRIIETAQRSSKSSSDALAGAASTSAAERAAYDSAFATLRDGKYEQAIVELQSFLKLYPTGEFAANAQYWLAEASFVQHRYDIALIEFERVVTRFPTSPKFSDALLKFGLAHYELGSWEQSSQTLNEVIRKFPNTSQAQLASQQLEKIKKEGH